MDDKRTKTVRISDKLNNAVQALGGYYNIRADEVIEKAIPLLWDTTFPNTPMPGTAEPKKAKK
ncbi:MAG: hypothetical protein DPW14_10515 [Planctomycetes bacterium]|nr:hypothetical protein [Planctomycetota bacterium]